MIEESAYLIGALIASALLLVSGPQTALIVLTVLCSAGALLIYAPARLRSALRAGAAPRVLPVAPARKRRLAALSTIAGPITSPNLRRLVMPLVPMGGILGIVGIIIPAVSKASGNIGFSGVLFACISVGGLLGAIWFSRTTWKASLRLRQVIFTLVRGLPITLLLINPNPYTLGILLGGLLISNGGLQSVSKASSALGLAVVAVAMRQLLTLKKREQAAEGS